MNKIKMMKKTAGKAATACVLTAAVALYMPVAASAASAAPGIVVNGMPLAADSYVAANGRTYVNVAALAQLTGAVYTLNEETDTVTVNGMAVDVELRDDVPYAYVRTLAAAAGASSVKWDAVTNTVQVVYNTKLHVYGDTVSQLGECIVQSRFVAGDSIVFRMTAVNPVTGLQEEGAQLKVHLSTGEVLEMTLGEHPPGSPDAVLFWAAKYAVTDETPLGTIDYYVTAESGGLTGEYRPFHVMPSMLTIVPADAGATASAE